MAFAKRKATSMEMTLRRSLKKSVKQVKGLTTKDKFIETYKYCYPNLWLDVCDFHRNMVCWNKRRMSRGLNAIYTFHSPEAFFRNISRRIAGINPLRQNGNDVESPDKETFIESLRKASLQKLAIRDEKRRLRERYKQYVKPSYVHQHVQAYYQTRKRQPMDIDSRYLIVHELAKYKCEETIRFLKSLVQCEKNMPLQHYAWKCLNGLGVTGVHKGRRKGNKKMTYTKQFTPIVTPQDLLKAIYNSPLEKMKAYNLFLSHSYKDKDKLIELKDTLNRLGLNVYMDWVNDKDELHRTLTSADTAAVITERIKSSKVILYVHTTTSLDSKWTPWELGYAYALGKPILVYRPEPTAEEPEYLQLYPSVVIEKGVLLVDDQERISILEWLGRHNKKQ